MDHGPCGSWVNCVMGHMAHGSGKMTHFHLCCDLLLWVWTVTAFLSQCKCTTAPMFCQPIAYLFNLSLVTSTVPLQWKEATIHHPSNPEDYCTQAKQEAYLHPISITSLPQS